MTTLSQEVLDAWNVFKGWVETKAEPAVAKEATEIYQNDIKPELKAFVSQFDSGFGAKALAYATTTGLSLVEAVIAGTTNPGVAAAEIAETIWTDGVGIAKADAINVIANAIRTQVPVAAPAPAAPAAPAAQEAAAA